MLSNANSYAVMQEELKNPNSPLFIALMTQLYFKQLEAKYHEHLVVMVQAMIAFAMEAEKRELMRAQIQKEEALQKEIAQSEQTISEDKASKARERQQEEDFDKKMKEILKDAPDLKTWVDCQHDTIRDALDQLRSAKLVNADGKEVSKETMLNIQKIIVESPARSLKTMDMLLKSNPEFNKQFMDEKTRHPLMKQKCLADTVITELKLSFETAKDGLTNLIEDGQSTIDKTSVSKAILKAIKKNSVIGAVCNTLGSANELVMEAMEHTMMDPAQRKAAVMFANNLENVPVAPPAPSVDEMSSYRRGPR